MSLMPRKASLILVALLPACADVPLTSPEAPRAGKVASSAVVEVWWPTEGAYVEGVQPFKARLVDWQLGHYRMSWRVDGGQANAMGDSWEGGAHKEASVDVSAWTWRGAGPYTVTFEARDRKGRVVGERSVDVFVGLEPPADTAGTTPPDTAAPAPVDSTATPVNPLAGATFFIDPYSNARKQADAWAATRPADAEQLEKIARRSQADWFGDWNADVGAAVASRTTQILAAGALPVYVAYNIPLRDCGSYSAGGATSPDAYRSWIRAFAAGLAGRRAVVILEPDALAGMGCLSAADQQVRLGLLTDAVQVLTAAGDVAVYLDAGHPRWIGADDMAARLRAAGVEHAAGFALNVSNFFTTADNVQYGEAVAGLLNGKRFVIDTSRNGMGPTSDAQWCNPDGRALGTAPTTATASPMADAYLWIKRPGESDGSCNGGPAAGSWWADYALGLARNATQPAATLVASR